MNSYIQHPGKVAEAGQRFEHVMAITLDPRTNNEEGVIHCIVSREGDVQVSGYIDRSALYKIKGNLEKFEITDEVESGNKRGEWVYSVVQVAEAKNMGEPWEFGQIAFHPADHNISWIGGHASPGPLLPKSFIDIGRNNLLGIMNGREANTRMPDKSVKYGMFSVGLFIYDYEEGKIDWVSKEPLIIDSEAVIITFASQFVETKPGEGILYAHVDDSFVRAYTLKAEDIAKLLP